MTDISNTDDTINSSTIIDAIDELESLITGLEYDIDDDQENIDDLENEIEDLRTEIEDLDTNADGDELEELEAKIEVKQEEIVEFESSISMEESTIDDHKAELNPLKELASDGESYFPDWYSGITLIHEDHFEDHARELAEDVDGIDDAEWPMRHIDWAAAAKELEMDYTSVEFDGETYLARS